MLSAHIYPSTFEYATRILKITNTLITSKLADNIYIIAKSSPNFPGESQLDSHRRVIRINGFTPTRNTILKSLHFIEWSFKIFMRLRHEPIDIINCHSLSVLPICVAIKIWHKSILIYQPHELETETATSTGVRRVVAKWLEKRLIKFADKVFVVSQSISEHYRKDYHLSDVPVIMNVPIPTPENEQSKNNILKQHFSIPDTHLLFMYQGMLDKERGVHELLDAFKSVPPDKHIVFMGWGSLEKEISSASLQSSNIHLYPAVPPDQVIHFTRSADIGIALLEADCENHRCALPNKLFHYIHANLPVIVSDLPEMARIVDNYNCGWKVGTSPESIAATVRSISQDKIMSVHTGTIKARNDLHWNNEAKKLEDIYRTMLSTHHIKRALNPQVEYQICTNCIMDTSAPDITFDEQGVCNYCRSAADRLALEHYIGEPNAERLPQLIEEIKQSGRNKKYDCIIGVSGGVDSSYVAYLTKVKFGLRPLAVHFDNGWNSELAVQNIENLLNKLDIDLYTHVVDWEEFKDIQLSFLKSSIANCEIPTDHAIVALLYRIAAKLNVKYIIHGGNLTTESIMPEIWMHDAKDLRLLKSIHKQYGTTKITTFPTMGYLSLAWNVFIRRIKYVGILNYIDYNKEDAVLFLERELDWRKYEAKHFESIFTRFFQGYLLPNKFKMDKRRPHMSSLIVSGQMEREAALKAMSMPPYDPVVAADDIEYICQKFGLSREQFDQIMSDPIRQSNHFPNTEHILKTLSPFVTWIKRIATGRTG